jgi:predicted amidophosphoribosyltransferase
MKETPKLANCPDCGHAVSQRALTCPGCGRKIAFTTAVFTAAFWAMVLFAIISGFLYAALMVMNAAASLNR